MRLGRGLVAAALVAALLPRGADAVPPRAGLTPAAMTLELEAGQARTLDYVLQVAAQPVHPADLYLLVDGGASARPYLADVRRGLSAALGRLAARDVRVGVGEFRTTSPEDWQQGQTYRVLRRIGAVDGELARAVDRLGRDEGPLPRVLPGAQAHGVALDQAVTGDGHWPYVSAGQDAGFRAGTRTVVAVVTAAPFADDRTQPGRDDVVAALRAAGAEVFGLALDDAALPDLTALARGTGSVAETGVDCGAGRRIRPGGPAACVVSPRAAGGALAGMLYVPRRGDVTVMTAGTGVRRLSRRTFTVDPDHHTELRVRLDVACAAGDAGRTHEITLDALLSGTRIARARLTVHCRAR
jgi:hypothetical protein